MMIIPRAAALLLEGSSISLPGGAAFPLIPSMSSSPSPKPPPPILRLGSHKANPGAAAINSPAFEMDEWAPYRMAFLFVLVASSVAIWVSYKLLCESREDEPLQHENIYQPLDSQNLMMMPVLPHQQNDRHQKQQQRTNASSSVGSAALLASSTLLSSCSSASSTEDEADAAAADDLACLLTSGSQQKSKNVGSIGGQQKEW